MNKLLTILGVLLAILGALLAIGGIWLITLGGSWFYLFAGAAMAAVGVGVFKKKLFAYPLSLGLLVVSAIWAFWEVGTDFWQLVPRLIAFLVVALIASLGAHHLHNSKGVAVISSKLARISSLVFGVIIIGFFAGMFKPHPEVAFDGTPTEVVNAEAGYDQGGDWSAWGRNTSGDRYAQFAEINKKNVKDLAVAWTFRTGDLALNGAEYQVTPIKIADTLYLCTPFNKVFALDPVTGEQKWKFDPKVREGAGQGDGGKGWQRCRGVSYTETPTPQKPAAACQSRIVLSTIDAKLWTIDAKTGKACEDFGVNGSVDLLKNLGPRGLGNYYPTSAPLVAGNLIVVGGLIGDNDTVGQPSGVVRAYDSRTGHPVWAWDPANPKRSTPLSGDDIYPLESPNFWGTGSYDPQLGLIYIPTGNQTPDFWSGDRHPYSDDYNTSIVAIDVKTGVDKWHFRTANRDQFDYDVSSQPILYDLPNKNGEKTPVVIQLTKRGEIFVLDRRDGKPVFPVEERPVPTDAMPDMNPASTQPFSALSVGTTPLKESDMWGASIFDQLYCRIQFKQMRWEGPFTPLSDQKRTLIYPGYYGGMNWGGGALDAATATLYVNDIRMAQWGKFIKREEAKRIGLTPSAEGEYSQMLGTPWGVERSMFVSPLGVPCFKPPFGSMTAIDLTTGKTRWQIPMGTIEDANIHGFKPKMPIPLGMPTMGGPLVTKGGLVFFHGTLDFYLRALDSDSGEEIWRSRLPVGGQGAPMSYIGANSKQYVVVVAGGATRTGTNEQRGDYVIAYALPDKK